MSHLHETASVAALLYTRAPHGFMRETAGDLLRAVTTADRSIHERSPDAPTRLKLVRDLVLAAVGGAWLREHKRDGRLARLRDIDLALSAVAEGAVRFDSSCANVLRARFPDTVARAPWSPAARLDRSCRLGP